MTHVVKAPLVVAKLAEGPYAYLYAGVELPSNLADGEVERLLAEGFVELLAEPESELETPPAERALGALTGAELDALAKAENVDLAGAKNKADKVAAIEAARAATNEQQPEDPDQGSNGNGSDV